MLQRLALFTGSYNHIIDGVSLTLNRLVSYLEAQGTEVLILGPTVSDPPLETSGTFTAVPSTALPGRPDYRLSLLPSRSTRKLLRDFDPQIIHVATPDLLGLYALRCSRKMDVPLVASYHTHFASYLKHYGLEFMEGLVQRYLFWFFSKCEHVYVPTPPLMDLLAEAGMEDQLRFWGRGVDMDAFNPSWRSEDWREAHGVDEDDVLVTLVGRLEVEKGVNEFADTIRRLKAQGVSFKSMVVGKGNERVNLESRLPDTIFTGHLQKEELSRAFASSDIFLYPSDSEAFGNVIVEAMASGLPVVAAGGVGSSSHVEVGKTGYLAPADDVNEFARYTRKLIEDDDLREKLGKNARQHAVKNYDWQHTLGLLNGYYEELLSRHISTVA